jgi:hypothetical protein
MARTSLTHRRAKSCTRSAAWVALRASVITVKVFEGILVAATSTRLQRTCLLGVIPLPPILAGAVTEW